MTSQTTKFCCCCCCCCCFVLFCFLFTKNLSRKEWHLKSGCSYKQQNIRWKETNKQTNKKKQLILCIQATRAWIMKPVGAGCVNTCTETHLWLPDNSQPTTNRKLTLCRPVTCFCISSTTVRTPDICVVETIHLVW